MSPAGVAVSPEVEAALASGGPVDRRRPRVHHHLPRHAVPEEPADGHGGGGHRPGERRRPRHHSHPGWRAARRDKKIIGNAITPFILDRVKVLTGGASLEANIALVKNNALTGAKIAVALSDLLKRASDRSPRSAL